MVFFIFTRAVGEEVEAEAVRINFWFDGMRGSGQLIRRRQTHAETRTMPRGGVPMVNIKLAVDEALWRGT
jgi:hypothetical protein